MSLGSLVKKHQNKLGSFENNRKINNKLGHFWAQWKNIRQCTINIIQ
jgi:hypothetical protein